ncbi:antA/AntB antirepressor family protein [Sphingomonas sp. M6A6_1c]
MTTDLVLETRDIGGSLVETVDARRLHAFLENGDAFANWIGDRVRQYGFIEASDFVTYLVDSKKGRPAKDYAISVDMAKELSMVERNDKGKQARRYFIECEKRAKTSTAPTAHVAHADVSREYRLTMQQNVRWAKMAGLDGNQALIAANRATVALTGIDTLGLLGVSHLPAPQNTVLLTPTEIGARAELGSAQSVNLLLCRSGLQQCFTDSKGHKYYEPTEAGIREGAVMQDTGKKHASGTPVRQLRWSSTIIKYLTADHELAPIGV